MRRKLIRKCKKLALDFRILLKFWRDKRSLPLTSAQFKLYRIIHRLTQQALGKFPDLCDPQDYNDKIQWVKLFDQQPLVIECADKLLVKDYVQRVLGRKVCPETLMSGSHFEDLDLDRLPERFVIKTNHDSGSVFCVPHKQNADWASIKEKVERSLGRVYGEEKGEWNYQFIEPKVFAEEFIGDPQSNELPADYKFHCYSGKVAWLQYIYDRGQDVKETIVMPDGTVTDIHFDHNMKPVPGFEMPQQWDELISIAEKLSQPFKYVRIDLYLEGGQVYLGEMTFFPLKGCYLGEGQKVLGKLIKL